MGDFEGFFASRPRLEGDFWRARSLVGVAYYGEPRSRAMLRAVKHAKREGGADPWAFLEVFEQEISDDYKRQPRQRRAAAIAWCERIEKLCGKGEAA